VGAIIWQHGLFRNHIIVMICLDKGQPDPTRRFNLRAALMFNHPLNLAGRNKSISRQSEWMLARPADERQAAVPLHRIKAIAQHQGLQMGSRRRNFG